MQRLLSDIRALPNRVQLLLFGWLVLMVLLPFHGFISTWGGTTVGPLWLWKSWKEILLAVMVCITASQLLIDRALLKKLWRSWTTRIIILYGLLHVIAMLVVRNQTPPLVAGLAINLRIVTFFLISQVLFSYLKLTKKQLLTVILVPLGGVVLFGMLQMFVLPYNFLANFGYDKDITIAPFNTIDQQLDQLRIMSTTRGPNPLGAYLIMPLTVLYMMIVCFLRNYRKSESTHKHVRLLGLGALLLTGLTVLYGSHSRSAWIGFVLSVGLYTLLIASRRWRFILVGIGLVVSLTGAMLGYQYRETRFIQNVIIHDNPDIGTEVTSNSERRSALQKSLVDIKGRPLLGCAPGCAGPASFYDPDGAKLAENYYLQVGQEIGVFGIVLFLSFIALVSYKLYILRADSLALVLLSSLIGISVANLLLHVWADDTLAYVWWGVAGAILATIGVGKHSSD